MIKNDIWIKEQAQIGLITPFEPKIIRKLQDKAVISYGLSSFGYDIRLSSKDFRIFRHIPGTVIDPKNFNPLNLESTQLQSDDSGDYFILPAHSYGLGVALEKLSIPGNITVLCIGKSTYARCFTGETKVKLTDGDFTFLELIDRVDKGDRLYGFGVKNGKIIVQELVQPRYIDTNEVIRIHLDSGESFDCTPDHKILLRNGEYIEANKLTPDMSLYPIYDSSSHGYPSIYDSVKADNSESRLNGFCEVHRMVADHMILSGVVDASTSSYHVHHRDGNKQNNHPDNLEILSATEHIKKHNESDSLYKQGGERFKQLYESNKAFKDNINSTLHSAESKQKAYKGRKDYLESEKNKEILANASKRRWLNEDEKAKQSNLAKSTIGQLKRRHDITEDSVRDALLKCGSQRGAARLLKVDRTAFRRFPELIEQFKKGKLCYNHKITKIERIDNTQQTYCLTAPDTGNFALSCGVFVSNCGIIANLTPVEADWRGHLTLEFSNSSSADCRIYANEGVVQLLFFEGEPCETSYDARQGKYQDQPENIVIARV
jgi:deoxycytidine triphosphate deaminase